MLIDFKELMNRIGKLQSKKFVYGLNSEEEKELLALLEQYKELNI